MKDVVLKIFTILVITISVGICVPTLVEAANETPSSVMSGASNFITKGESSVGNAIDEDKLANTSNFLYNLLLGIGMVFAVAIGSVLGIKFMTSSVEEQAKIKELLVPYVAGCVVVFGAFGIWKLVVSIASGF